MSTFDYSKSQATALSLITKFGTDATIIRAGTPTGPAHNPTPGVPVEYACKAVFDTWRNDQIDGTLIQRGDLKILVASSGLTITPTPADKFKHSAKEYAIINVDPLQPAGIPVMWTVQARA